MSSAPSFTHCDWCGTSFGNQVIYLLHTQETGTRSNTTHHVGEDCCVAQGKHAEYANRFLDRWGCLPFMNFEYLETHENVTRMFARAKLCHERRRDKPSVKSLFQCAWRAYKKLSPDNQALVVK